MSIGMDEIIFPSINWLMKKYSKTRYKWPCAIFLDFVSCQDASCLPQFQKPQASVVRWSTTASKGFPQPQAAVDVELILFLSTFPSSFLLSFLTLSGNSFFFLPPSLVLWHHVTKTHFRMKFALNKMNHLRSLAWKSFLNIYKRKFVGRQTLIEHNKCIELSSRTENLQWASKLHFPLR